MSIELVVSLSRFVKNTSNQTIKHGVATAFGLALTVHFPNARPNKEGL